MHSLSLLAALGAVSVLAYVPVASDSPPGATPACIVQDKAKDEDSAQTCAMCHKDIHAEWKDRKHAKAWDDEVYQNSIKKKRNAKLCHACHIPGSVLAKAGRRPAKRDKNLHEGVTCVSCHKQDGKIHGPFGAKTDAHESVKDPMFAEKNSSGLCLSCHSTKIDVVLPVGRDFKSANLAEKGKSCVGCHMPEVERHMAVSPVNGKPTGEKRKGRSHAMLGPNDAEFCALAFKLSATKADGKLVLHMENGAGHGVPGLTTRSFHFFIKQLDGSGKALADHKLVIDSGNPLKVLETRQFPFDLAAGAESVEVRIEHNFLGKPVAKIAEKKLKLDGK